MTAVFRALVVDLHTRHIYSSSINSHHDTESSRWPCWWTSSRRFSLCVITHATQLWRSWAKPRGTTCAITRQLCASMKGNEYIARFAASRACCFCVGIAPIRPSGGLLHAPDRIIGFNVGRFATPDAARAGERPLPLDWATTGEH